MKRNAAQRRIWGWYFYDWAAQPYATLLLTFIFAPYIKELLGEGTAAQSAWGYGVAAAGAAAALLAPVLGGIADRAGARVRLNFMWGFSALYVFGAWGVWFASPASFNLPLAMTLFGLGLLGLEFSTIFTNAMLPGLAPRKELGRISGTGWAFGYLGGLIALVLTLLFFAEDARTGLTVIGLPPAFGLDPAMREGTRAVGPFTAIWYIVFIVPFFAWVREPQRNSPFSIRQAARRAWPDLRAALGELPARPSLSAFLAGSMFYRDALNALYVFGGIYAAGVLGWSVTDVGVFGILAVISGAVFSWAGGHADRRFGPKPVVMVSILILAAVTLSAVFISRTQVLGLSVGSESRLPDIAFYLLGIVIGGAGGTLGAASRTLMVAQAPKGRMTQAFGLYALAGKATSFLAPLTVAIVTDVTQSQQMGILPLLVLFLMGLVLLSWVRADGDEAR